MATFAVGDIHGNLRALEDLLAQLAPRLGAGDTVVFLGDYIDRGPASKECLDLLLSFQENSPSEVVTLLGNHESSLLRTERDFTRHSWLLVMDAWPTVASYSLSAAEALRAEAKRAGARLYQDQHRLPYELFFDAVPESHLAFLRQLRTHHRIDDTVFAHAGIDPDRGPVEQQPEAMLIWGTSRFPERHGGPDTVVYGHWGNAVIDAAGWPQPAVERFAIGIDSIKHGVLTAIQLPERRVFQSARYAEPWDS